MPYNVPTLRQLIASGQLDIEAALDTILPKFGIELALNSAVSAAIRDAYDHQIWIVRQIIPTSESDDQTIVELASFEGVIRKQASYASGPATLVGNVSVPTGTLLTHKDGRQYAVTASNVPSGGNVVVAVQAQEPGIDGNLSSGETLSLVTPVPGIQSAGISGDITGGADIEPISQLLERLLFRKRNPPMGGAVADYVAWMREVSGVTRAWAYDSWQGRGTVGIGWVFDDRADIIPTPTDRAFMLDYLFRHPDPATGVPTGRPGGIEPVFMGPTLKTTNLSITPIPDTTDIRAAIELNLDGYERTLQPGDTLLLSKVRTAIGSAAGVKNYTLDLIADVTADIDELNVIGVVTWPTL